MAKVSVIITHWAMNKERSDIMRKSLKSLFETTPEAEIIVVDNGGSLEDSLWLAEMCNAGKIACYIKNRNNMHFGYARNQALKLSSGEYICIADNDILYKDGWLEECIDFLERNEGKYLATPLRPDPMNRRQIRWVGEVDGWKLNERAGSNCWVMRRGDLEVIGVFDVHRIAGSKWVDRYRKLHYAMACMPEPKCEDLAFRAGYNFNEPVVNIEL